MIITKTDNAQETFIMQTTLNIIRKNRQSDDSGAHAAYVAGDLDRYFKIVPKYLLDHALAATQCF